MAVTPVTSTTATAATTSKASTLSSATANEQQDRFMKLLVAQMKNQDPLNPMDNAQMTSQVAQINTVGGIEKLNRTVESLLSQFSNLQSQSATQLPGRTVLLEGSAMALSEGTAVGGVELAAAADAVSVDILDSAGSVVQTVELGKSAAGVRAFGWDGVRANGETAADGNYKMRVRATASGKTVEAATLSAARVQAVSSTAAGVQVDLGTAGIHAYGDLKSFL